MIDFKTGDSVEVVRSLPDSSVDLVATSPPFLALRDYSGLDGQYGQEATPADYLDTMLGLACELGRVLTDTGSLVFEIGDSFAGSGGAGGDYNSGGLRDGQKGFAGSAAAARGGAHRGLSNNGGGHHLGGVGWPLAKSLCGIPTLFTWSLAYGRNLLNPSHEFEPWRIRNVIVWARSNPPVGALGDKVRPATSYITVATKSGSRWFDLDAVRTEPDRANMRRTAVSRAGITGRQDQLMNPVGEDGQRIISNAAGAPPTDYWVDEYDTADLAWLVNTQPSRLPHYAMWPPKLAERLVLSMCPLEVCRDCGEPRRRIVDVEPSPRTNRDAERLGSVDGNGHHGHLTRKATTVGWSDCGHGNYRPGVVLDPFAGTGTTLCVAECHNRDSIGIDLDPDLPQLVDRRMTEVKRSLFDYKDPTCDNQLSLDDLLAG